MELNTAIIGLGANQGDARAQLKEAVRTLGATMRVAAVSSLYRTEPVGLREQPDFLNAVCVVETALAPHALLAEMQRLEERMGRVRTVRFGPRTLDLDLLDFEGRVLDSEALTLPHPRLAERAFVLVPLAEVAPEWRHPVLRRTARELLAAGGSTERVERVGPLLNG